MLSRRRWGRSRPRCTAERRRGCSTSSRPPRRPATRRPTCTACSPAASGSWASGIASTGRRTRARVLRRTARELRSPRYEAAERFEQAAHEALQEAHPERPLPTNVDYWAAIVLDVAHIPPDMYPAMFGCARVAGWAAHILEQRRTGKLIRPSARYVGPPAHTLSQT